MSNKEGKVHKLRRPVSNIIYVLFFLLFTVIWTTGINAAELKTVRVGYYENEVFQEGAGEGKVKTGYAYEYYQKLSEYTGWHYEYVYGDFSDLYDMLLKGDIDLLAGLAWREDRQEIIGYPESPVGNETYDRVMHGSGAGINVEREKDRRP